MGKHGIRTRCKSANSTTDLQPYDIATKPQVNSLRTGTMAKSKNSSQHNQSKKAHRNGIKKPKTCSARNNEGLEGVEGGQAGDGMNFITKVLSLRDLAVGSHWQGRIVLWGEST